ncbi:MAG TPA: phosphotransferase [Gaiellaceae bacterium]
MIEVLQQLVGAPVVLEELKHKPGRRRTLRARGPRGSAIAKVYASDRATTVARRIAALAGGPPEPVVPSVLHVDPSLHLVVLSEVVGDPLRVALLEGDHGTSARVGAAIGAWHAAWDGNTPAPLEPHTIGRELEILRSRADTASPAVAEVVGEALPHLGSEWRCTTVVHRDLYEEQVVAGERVGLIDLDDAALGPPELDVGNLLAHIELLERRRERELGRETQVLMKAYAQTGPGLDEPLLDRCRRLALLRLASLNDEVGLAAAALPDGMLA